MFLAPRLLCAHRPFSFRIMSTFTALDESCVNTIRCLAADMVDKSNSGHPGAPMGLAAAAHVLFSRHMRFHAQDPAFFNRDRFVLSNGHACALQYTMLHLFGYDVTMEDLKSFRQVDSKTPGHPERGWTPGVEVTTGPLGQGISSAVGLAMAEAHLNVRTQGAVDHFTYVICGDGCLMEGVTQEAISLAGHLGLGKLIVLYDDNKITIDGSTDLAFTEDVPKRFAACGWHTLSVENGSTDMNAIHAAVEAAKAETNKPSIISVKTVIGYGSSMAGSHKVHGSPLGTSVTKAMKQALGWSNPDATFVVPEDVAAYYQSITDKRKSEALSYTEKIKADAAKWSTVQGLMNPSREEFEKRKAAVAAALPVFKVGDKAVATRKASEMVLHAITPHMPNLLGGSADLTPSTLTTLPGMHDFQHGAYDGRYIRFGVREHGMAAIINGIACHTWADVNPKTHKDSQVPLSGLLPFGATFLNFIGYALGAVRLSAVSHCHVLYIATHDSIGLGEDGPTHQPIEMLASLRSLPNMLVFRPCDGNETSGAYFESCFVHTHQPSLLALSRQEVPTLEGSSREKVAYGGYTLKDYMSTEGGRLDLVLAGTGTEVSLCVDVAKALSAKGHNVRVVSMPCLELFDAQPREYRASVLPEGVPVMSVEALATYGWNKYSHVQCGMRTFGASGPYKQVYDKFGLTAPKITERALKVVEHYRANPVPTLEVLMEQL